jgi:hypothetical protein
VDPDPSRHAPAHGQCLRLLISPEFRQQKVPAAIGDRGFSRE